MEYVKITFPGRRRVHIDTKPNGYTNEVLRVEAGTHVFTLELLAKCRPESHTVEVKETTVLEPMVIAFLEKEPT
jgi:hypothetical protein